MPRCAAAKGIARGSYPCPEQSADPGDLDCSWGPEFLGCRSGCPRSWWGFEQSTALCPPIPIRSPFGPSHQWWPAVDIAFQNNRCFKPVSMDVPGSPHRDVHSSGTLGPRCTVVRWLWTKGLPMSVCYWFLRRFLVQVYNLTWCNSLTGT